MNIPHPFLCCVDVTPFVVADIALPHHYIFNPRVLSFIILRPLLNKISVVVPSPHNLFGIVYKLVKILSALSFLLNKKAPPLFLSSIGVPYICRAGLMFVNYSPSGVCVITPLVL